MPAICATRVLCLEAGYGDALFKIGLIPTHDQAAINNCQGWHYTSSDLYYRLIT